LLVIGIIAGFVIALFVLDDSERERQVLNRMLEAESRIRECTNCNGSGYVYNPYYGNRVPCSNCCGKGKYIVE